MGDFFVFLGGLFWKKYIALRKVTKYNNWLEKEQLLEMVILSYIIQKTMNVIILDML